MMCDLMLTVLSVALQEYVLVAAQREAGSNGGLRDKPGKWVVEFLVSTLIDYVPGDPTCITPATTCPASQSLNTISSIRPSWSPLIDRASTRPKAFLRSKRRSPRAGGSPRRNGRLFGRKFGRMHLVGRRGMRKRFSSGVCRIGW